MYTDEGVDTGDIAISRAIQIGEMETAGDLNARLARLGAALLVEALTALERGVLPRTPQNHLHATHYPKLTNDSGRINWCKPAVEIARMVRGFNPWPGAHTLRDGAFFKIWLARAVCAKVAEPGEIIIADPKKGLVVACGEGALEITMLQAPGGRQMDARAYLRGNPLLPGTVLRSES
jgi:methionyl-tRNA formyltransferase